MYKDRISFITQHAQLQICPRALSPILAVYSYNV